MDVFTTCFHCISFTEFEKPAKRVFSEELWITCVWTETCLRDTPVRVSRNPHIHVISLPLHVNKTNLASRSFLFLYWATGLKMSVCSYESEKSWLSKRCGGVTGGSGTRGRRGSEITCCLSLPLALSLSVQSPPSRGVYTLLRSLLACSHTLWASWCTHTYCLSPLTWLLVLIVHIKEEELECRRDCKIFLDWVSWCVYVHTRVGKVITTAAALVHEARIKKKKWL